MTFVYFSQIKSALNSDKDYQYMKTNIHIWLHLANFISELEMFETKVEEKIKTHILHPPKIFFPENRAVYDIYWYIY